MPMESPAPPLVAKLICRPMPWTRNTARSVTRNRNAWMWLAIAAVAFTSVAAAEAGTQPSRGYAHPVFEFLARTQNQNPGAHSATLRFANPGSRRHVNSLFRSNRSGTLIAFLPVLFIGLVSPLALSSTSTRPLGRAPAAPFLSALFQRPPPSLA